ncbi:MAG: AraC family transcriptional regulator [Bacteroidales bacterium]|nr:AraC family transcriptional regulator [Bacteroidales bacterium]
MPNKSHKHPLTSQSISIDERGLMVFDDIRQMPVYHVPYISPYLTVTLNLQGWVRTDYDMRPTRFEAHDIAVVLPGHTLLPHESSDDYRAILLAMTPKLTNEMKAIAPSLFTEFYQYNWQPHFHLEEDQFDNLLHMLQVLRNLTKSSHPPKDLVINGLLHIMAIMLQDYRRENGLSARSLSPRQELFTRFYQAITEHYQENREVRYYASLFCLTPKHFSSIIKQQTGINAKDWISRHVILKAKMLLHEDLQMNMQQIADSLGFPDQTTFSRYFKTETGITPSEFRRQ